MNSNDTTRTGPTTAHAGGTVADPTHGAPANPGLDLIRHRTRSVPGHSVTGLSRSVYAGSAAAARRRHNDHAARPGMISSNVRGIPGP